MADEHRDLSVAPPSAEQVPAGRPPSWIQLSFALLLALGAALALAWLPSQLGQLRYQVEEFGDDHLMASYGVVLLFIELVALVAWSWLRRLRDLGVARVASIVLATTMVVVVLIGSVAVLVSFDDCARIEPCAPDGL